MNDKVPNFFVIGAMKSATTSLYTYLYQHPEIFMTDIKEPMFFNNYQQQNDYKLMGTISKKNTDFSKYLNLFSKVDKEIAVGEASPSYIYNPKAASLIKSKFPNSKIIAILRHPTDRAYSNFLHVRRAGRETELDFSKALDVEHDRIKDNWSPLYHYVNQGYYSVQLERYFKEFPKDNIRIYLFEDLINNPNQTLRDIFDFLSVKTDLKIDVNKKSNVSGDPNGLFGWIVKKMRFYNLMPNITISKYLPSFIISFITKVIYKKPQKLDNHLRNEITKTYYLDEIKKLEKIIGRDLSHWSS